MSSETLQPLTADETARFIDFARACKAAARAVLLYPEGHPAIAATLDVPLLLWTFPEERTGGRLRLNSFCGANLASHTLSRRASPCSAAA